MLLYTYFHVANATLSYLYFSSLQKSLYVVLLNAYFFTRESKQHNKTTRAPSDGTLYNRMVTFLWEGLGVKKMGKNFLQGTG